MSLNKKYLIIKKKIKPIIKTLNDNNFEISLILYPRKINEELVKRNIINGNILSPLNLLFIT